MTQQLERIEGVAREIGSRGLKAESQSLMDAAKELRERIVFESEDAIVLRNETRERMYRNSFFDHDRDFGTVVLTGTIVPVILTPTENRLLMTLEERPGIVYEHETLIERVLGLEGLDSIGPDTHNLYVVVGRLRKKLNDDPKNPQIIGRARFRGYFLYDKSKVETPDLSLH